ncbi:MAG: hypothetical protein LBS14_03375 [Holosporaceae bacterium]|nr:hypothetical protein [Holosporaceae bacterium]
MKKAIALAALIAYALIQNPADAMRTWAPKSAAAYVQLAAVPLPAAQPNNVLVRELKDLCRMTVNDAAALANPASLRCQRGGNGIVAVEAYELGWAHAKGELFADVDMLDDAGQIPLAAEFDAAQNQQHAQRTIALPARLALTDLWAPLAGGDRQTLAPAAGQAGAINQGAGAAVDIMVANLQANGLLMAPGAHGNAANLPANAGTHVAYLTNIAQTLEAIPTAAIAAWGTVAGGAAQTAEAVLGTLADYQVGGGAALGAIAGNNGANGTVGIHVNLMTCLILSLETFAVNPVAGPVAAIGGMPGYIRTMPVRYWRQIERMRHIAVFGN